MINPRTEWRLVAGVIALFLAVGLWYSLAVPPFETPDEVFHYAFARHLAAGNSLPVQNPAVEAPWEQEGSQAPLYYWLVGRLTAGIDQRDFPQLSVRNQRANIGDPLFPGNKNFMRYSSVEWPLTGSNLALHIGRWFSLVLGALTLLFTYWTARLAFADAPQLALVTLLTVAAIPQFAFISASFSNDSLINTATAAVILWLAWLIRLESREPQTRSPSSWWRWLLLGVLLGIAALSKLQGLGLVLVSGFTVLWIAWQRRDWLLPLRVVLPVALPALVIAGWWYWRNYTLYNDWFGVGNLLANNGRRGDALTLAGFWREFRGLRYSFWGLFGWFNILLPRWIYAMLDALTLVALAGLIWRLPRAATSFVRSLAIRDSQFTFHNSQFIIRLLLAVWAALSLALLLYWTSQATGSQGRLLFPGLGALIALWVLGLEMWVRRLPRLWHSMAWLTAPALLFASSIYALAVLIPASYRAPEPIAAVPADATSVNFVYSKGADQLTVLAFEIPAGHYSVGDRVPVTLYLQAAQPVSDDYQLFIQFLDEQGVEVGNLTSHPGWGRNPSSRWPAGAIYADAYPVVVTAPLTAPSPLLARVYVGFVDPATEESGRFPLPAQTIAGENIDPPIVGEVVIYPHKQSQPANLQPVGAQFGGVIQLSGYAAPSTVTLTPAAALTVTVQWDALGMPATNYTAFVQLRSAAGQTVAGFDQAPGAMRFPTSAWRAGDRIISEFALSLPAETAAGEYALWIGLYETASQGALRLPITAAAGQLAGDGEVLLGIVTVTSE